MPRFEKKTIKSQKQIQAQDTFRWTTPDTKVNARAVDPYARPTKDSGADQLAAVLNDVTSTMRNVKDIKKDRDRKDMQRAADAFFMGHDLDPENESSAFIQQYELLEGQAGVLDFENQLNALYDERKHDLTPEEWTQERDKLIASHTEGKSNFFLRGFVPKALEHSNKVDDSFRKAKLKETQTKVKSNLQKQAKLIVEQALEAEEDDYGLAPGLIREKLTEMQENTKGFGLSKTDVSEQFIRAIGKEAVNTGNPELMNFIDAPDKTGNILRDNAELGALAEQYERAAMAAEKALEENDELERKKNNADYVKGAFELLRDWRDGKAPMSALADVEQMLEDNPERFEVHQYNSLRTSVSNARSGAAQQNNDDATFDDLSWKLKNMDPYDDPTDVEIFRAHADGLINDATRDKFLDELKKNTAGGLTKDPDYVRGRELVTTLLGPIRGRSQRGMDQDFGANAADEYNWAGMAITSVNERLRAGEIPEGGIMQVFQEEISKYQKMKTDTFGKEGGGEEPNPINSMVRMWTNQTDAYEITDSEALWKFRQLKRDFSLTQQDLLDYVQKLAGPTPEEAQPAAPGAELAKSHETPPGSPIAAASHDPEKGRDLLHPDAKAVAGVVTKAIKSVLSYDGLKNPKNRQSFVDLHKALGEIDFSGGKKPSVSDGFKADPLAHPEAFAELKLNLKRLTTKGLPHPSESPEAFTELKDTLKYLTQPEQQKKHPAAYAELKETLKYLTQPEQQKKHPEAYAELKAMLKELTEI